MSIKPRLTYFDGRGRAEPIRMIFAEAGVEYDDHRIQRETWASMKSTMPFGQLPVLHIDGVDIAQSMAALRYAARKYDLMPTDPIQAGTCDMISEAIEDITVQLSRLTHNPNATDAEKAKYKDETLPTWLRYFDALLGSKQYLVGDSCTYADIALFNFLHDSIHHPEVLETFPRLVDFKNRMAARPKLAAWLASRPVTRRSVEISQVDRAKLDLKVQRDQLTHYQKRINEVIERETTVARTCMAQGKRRNALIALKKKRWQEQLLAKTDGMLMNLHQMISTIEFTEIEKQVFDGLKQGTTVLQQLNREMSVEAVDELMADTQEAIDKQNEIEQALGTQLDEADMEAVTAELEALESQMIADRLPAAPESAPVSAPVSAAPLSAPASAASAATEPAVSGRRARVEQPLVAA
ncbi:putative charged multivesicular body protein 6 [Paratrimastix pyriformis]|uniref:Charged multivesicular body protein 6 n=1 Tax=Paratrimastix pyriformis TaxID=342808 RepID=A0ABQ8UKF6_9EUKA|nr:putative charged multivesicular body protein 6 [Paratrimastix pyriformis]